MSPESYNWVRAIHLFAVFMWMGTMTGLAHTLVAHANADLGARAAFHKIEKMTAMMMDIGGTLSIVTGVYFLTQIEGVMKHGYMHAKLGLIVVGPLAIHGFLRVKVRKYRESNVAPLPGVLPPLITLLALTIIILIVVRPF